MQRKRMNQLALTNKRMMYFCFSKASIHLLQITCGLMHGNKGQFCHMSSPKHFESEAISSIMAKVEMAKNMYTFANGKSF